MPQPDYLLTWMRNCYKAMSTTHQVLQDISLNFLQIPCCHLFHFFVFVFLLPIPLSTFPKLHGLLIFLHPSFLFKLFYWYFKVIIMYQMPAASHQAGRNLNMPHFTPVRFLPFFIYVFMDPLTQTVCQCSNTSSHTVLLFWSKRNLSHLQDFIEQSVVVLLMFQMLQRVSIWMEKL